MTLQELLQEARRLDTLTSLYEREDGFWQATLNARVSRMYFAFSIQETLESALADALVLYNERLFHEGPPKKACIERKTINIDELLKDLQ